MKAFLQNYQKEVERCEAKLLAANALDKHASLKAREEVKRLILSPKGLSVAFGAGMAKGYTQDKSNSTGNMQKTLVKQAISAWLGS